MQIEKVNRRKIWGKQKLFDNIAVRIETARNVNARIVIISFTTITVQNIALFELFTV